MARWLVTFLILAAISVGGYYYAHQRAGDAIKSEMLKVVDDIGFTAEDRAAANAVGDGNMIWIRLLAADGKTVDAVSVSLRVLLANPNGVIERSLRARLTGARVDLALDSGLTDGRRGNRAGSNEGGR